MTTRPQKITFGEMRASGVRNVLIYCCDHRCSHCNIVPDDADRWPDDLRISDIEDRFVCTVCGQRGADIRPDWRTASGATVREKYLREIATNPKWKDATQAGSGVVLPGAKPGKRAMMTDKG